MKEVLDLLNVNHIFKGVPADIKARIIPLLESMTLQEGETVYKEREQALSIYYISSGTVQISNKSKVENRKEGTFFGEEAFFEMEEFISDASVTKNANIIKIPFGALEILRENNPKLAKTLFSSFTGKKMKEEPIDFKHKPSPNLKSLIAWVVAFIVPVFVYMLLGESATLSNNTKLFLSIFSGGIVFWVFNIFHECIPGLIILAATLILGIVPSEQILSGFSSKSFIMVMSLWAIGLLLIDSGIIQRIILHAVLYIPQNSGVYNVFLFFLGGLITPAVPSIVNRTSIAPSIINEMLDILRVKKGTVLSAKISASVFFGLTIMSSIFFTGSMMNFIVFGFLPLQEQQTIQTIGWFYSSMAVGGVLCVFYLVISSIFFATREKVFVRKEIIDLQIKARGSLTSQEFMAASLVLFFIISVFTSEYHRIPIAWISLFILFAILSMKLVSARRWQQSTDWSFLLFLASIVGINSAMTFLKIDQFFSPYVLSFLKSVVLEQSQTGVLMAIMLSTIVIRLILPIGPTIALLSTVMLQVSEFFGLNLWVLGFVVLITADIWWFPYQSPFYKQFVYSFSNGIPYKERTFLSFNVLMNIGRIVAVYLSIPYWKSLGLMFS